jgi:hypothetical protein
VHIWTTFWKPADLDNDGKVSLDEYLKLTQTLQKQGSFASYVILDLFGAIFDVIDRDGDGHLPSKTTEAIPRPGVSMRIWPNKPFHSSISAAMVVYPGVRLFSLTQTSSQATTRPCPEASYSVHMNSEVSLDMNYSISGRDVPLQSITQV